MSPEQQEAYFQEQVAQGERLAVMGRSSLYQQGIGMPFGRRLSSCASNTSLPTADLTGPEHQVEAASHFYRALRVYPQPIELLGSELRYPLPIADMGPIN